MQAVVEFEPMHSVPRTGLLADWTAGALCRKDPIEVFTNAQIGNTAIIANFAFPYI